MKQDLALIEQFLDALWLERNLAENTLSAYRRDLTMLVEWLHHRGLSLASVGSDDLQALLAERQSGGYKATSTARLLSAVRRFFQHLYREKFARTIPARCWPRRSYRSGCQKISVRRRLSACRRRRWRSSRWNCAIKRCWRCCMPPACASRSWWG